MKVFYSIQSYLTAILLLEGGHLIYGQTALERSKLEKKFTELHPKKNQIIWKEIENLKPDTLERVCNDVLSQIVDSQESVDDFQYVPVAEEKLEKERIMKNGAVDFVHGLQYTINMPVIKCEYEGNEFYLCHGDDNHVFRLFLDPFASSLTFRSGPHKVEWNVKDQ